AVSETGWRHLSPGKPGADAPFGIDATAALPEAAEGRMSLTSTEPDGFDRLVLELVARPNGTPLTISLDQSAPLRVPTAAPTPRVKRIEFLPHRRVHQAELVATGPQPTMLLAWAAERRGPGIIYENHGTIVATAALVQKMTPSTVAFELAERRPALVV